MQLIATSGFELILLVRWQDRGVLFAWEPEDPADVVPVTDRLAELLAATAAAGGARTAGPAADVRWDAGAAWWSSSPAG